MENFRSNRLLHAGFWSVLLSAIGSLICTIHHDTKTGTNTTKINALRTKHSSEITQTAYSNHNNDMDYDEIWAYDDNDTQHHRNLLNRQSISVNDSNAPSLAWLMTFPDSGTTYTQKLIQQVTETTTANVYGTVYALKNGNSLIEQQSSIPVFNDRLSGPFKFSEYDLPKSPSHLLTKTHCGGYCTDCPPHRYIVNKLNFYQHCRTGVKLTIDPKTGKKTKEQLWHDPSLVKKAVHLFRNPLDNVASRFRHVWKLGKTSEMEGVREKFSFDSEGFHAYCEYIDSKYADAFAEWNTEGVLELARKVPCHTEFFKYIQFHNLGFRVTREILEIPTLVINFEHFQHHLDVTVTRLLRFLELPRVNNPPDFTYNRYLFFTEEEKLNAYLFMKKLASDETWSYVKPYCNQERGSKKLCKDLEEEENKYLII